MNTTNAANAANIMKIRITELVPDTETISLVLKLVDNINLIDTDQLNEHISKLLTVFNILIKYGMKDLAYSFINPITNGIPTLSHFLLNYDSIIQRIIDPNDRETFMLIDIPPLMINKKPIELVQPIQIPRYNLLHFGMNCHFNSCINILSSLTDLLIELAVLCKSKQLTPIGLNIYQHLLNTLSYLDLNPRLGLTILQSLHINPNIINESTETMKSLMRELYNSGVSLSTVFFWDSTDEFYKKTELTHTFSNKLSELKPKYVLCNVHDFNSIYDIDEQQIDLEGFDVLDEYGNPECSYTLSSFSIFMSAHYITAFMIPVVDEYKNRYIEVKNDLSSRCDSVIKQYAWAFNKPFQHTLCCYVRSDLMPELQQTETKIPPSKADILIQH